MTSDAHVGFVPLSTFSARLNSSWLVRGARRMSAFKGRRFGGEVILWVVCWYCRCGISYRHLEQIAVRVGCRRCP